MSHSCAEISYTGIVNGDDVKLSSQSISGTKNLAYDFFNSFDRNDDRKEQIIY